MELDFEHAEYLAHFLVCSDCWGELVCEKIEDGKYSLVCETPGCTTPAFISTGAVKFRQRISEHWYQLAKLSLREAIPWLMPEAIKNMSPEEIIRSLGY